MNLLVHRQTLKVFSLLGFFIVTSGWFAPDLIFNTFLNISLFSDAYCNKKTENLDLKLKSDLLCNYDIEIRPNANNTPIALKYILRSFSYVSLLIQV